MAAQYPKLPATTNRWHFKRLLWRAGFGAGKAQMDRYAAEGLGPPSPS